MRAIFWGMVVVFLGCAAVQYNDPDGPVWAAVYISAAAWTVLARHRLVPRWLSGGTALAVGIVAMVVVFPVLAADGLHLDMLHWTMASDGEERLREGGGLLLVSAWLGSLSVGLLDV